MQYAITQRYRRCYNTPVNVQCVDNLSLILGWSVYTLWMPIKYVTIFYNFSPWMLVVCTVVESAKLMKPAQKHRESKQYSRPYFPVLISRSLFSALFFLFLVFLLHLPFPVSVSVSVSVSVPHFMNMHPLLGVQGIKELIWTRKTWNTQSNSCFFCIIDSALVFVA